MPIRADSKLFLFNKPRGIVCSKSDEKGRPTIYDYLKARTKLDLDKVWAVGKLDYNADGLMLITNNEDMANCLESMYSNFINEYRIRLHGRFTKEKFIKMR